MTLAEGVARLERFGEIARLLWKYGRSDLVEQAGAAQLFGDGDDVDRLPFGARALRCGCSCLPVSGHDDGRRGRDLPALFVGDSRGLCVDARERDDIPVGIVAGDGVVFPVVLRSELPVPIGPVRAHEVDRELHTVSDRFDLRGAALHALRFREVDLPGANQRIGCLRRQLAVPLRVAVGKGKLKKVSLGSDTIRSARDMGIGFGD